jgi:thioredoxin 1
MKKNLAIIAAIIIGVGTVAWLKNSEDEKAPHQQNPENKPQVTRSRPENTAQSAKQLPRLVEIGAGKCEACKKMAPVIEGIKTDFSGELQVKSIDVFEDKQAARKYRYRLIPTQIVLDGEGRELWRHVGYIPREQLLTRMKELGVLE